jgi:hypothetical protein
MFVVILLCDTLVSGYFLSNIGIFIKDKVSFFKRYAKGLKCSGKVYKDPSSSEDDPYRVILIECK